MEKYGFEKEWKEDVLIRKENASTVLVMDGEEVEIDCPEIARGNVSGWEHHALFLETEAQRMENIQ